MNKDFALAPDIIFLEVVRQDLCVQAFSGKDRKDLGDRDVIG